MKSIRITGQRLAAFALLCLAALTGSAGAEEQGKKTALVTFDWPEDAAGVYSVRGISEQEGVGDKGGNEKKKLTIPIPSGKYELRVGDGLVPFFVSGNRVGSIGNAGVGVKLDAAARTFHFDTVTVEVEPNGFVMPLQISGVAQWFNRSEPKPAPLKLVPSQYRLMYGGGRADILVGAGGRVELVKPVEGFTSEGSRLVLNPRPFTVEPVEGVKWNITRGTAPYRAGPGEVLLLPGNYTVGIWAPGKKVALAPFTVGQDFMLSAQENGPFTEVVTTRAEGAPDVTISMPNGRALMQARLDKAGTEKKAYEEFLLSSDKAAWKQDFVVQDYMRFFDFPEESLTYPIEFPAGKVKANGLWLTALYDDQARPVPFQLSNVNEQGGFLKSATLTLRSDLPKGAIRRFRLTYGLAQAGESKPAEIKVEKSGVNEAILQSNRLAVKVPLGEKSYAAPALLSEVPAPIVALARANGPLKWMGTGKLSAPGAIKVRGWSAKTEEVGPLFVRHRVSYRFSNGGVYTVTLGLNYNDDHVTVGEEISGLKSTDEVYFRFDMGTGLSPDQRQVISNEGYTVYSGAYGSKLEEGGRLPFQLSLYTANSLGIMRAAAFWKNGGDDVLLLALDRLRDWKTETRYVWGARRGPGNLVFYQDESGKYFKTRLEGNNRYWAIGAVPLTRNVPGGFLVDNLGGGPEIRLWEKLSDFSLNKYKDWGLDWEENLTARPDDETPPPMTFDEWVQSRYGPESKIYKFLPTIPALYWDSSSTVGPVSFRMMPPLFQIYAASRANWTLEERRRARTLLLFLAYSSEDDANMPHHSMMGGHPNFAMDIKQTLPLACATFPNHPNAKKWRDSFLKFFDEFLDVYQRKADLANNAQGGRWTEAMACYSGTALHAILQSAKSLKRYDGTDLLADPRMHTWMKWYRDVMMSPHEGQRLIPPEGAHSDSFEPDFKGGYWNSLFETARLMKPSAPQLSEEMRWIETNGKEGVKPDVRSVLVRDQGPFLHHDFGGPHESYLHFMQIGPGLNYRWGQADMLYYGARNKIWSYNGREDTGDEYNINNISSFSVAGKGLGGRVTDQPLYDFGFAQFYRALASPMNLAVSSYKSRGMMLLRDDYLVLSDEVEDNQRQGQFAWSNAWEFPEIYQLKPGVTDFTTTDLQQVKKGREMGKKTQVRRYKGVGDFLTVIAPAAVTAQAQPYGALVNGEYVFVSDGPQNYAQGGVVFKGAAGYARAKQLALFEGEEIALNGFVLRRDGGDFGASADATGASITGRIVGRQGGRLFVTPPAGFNAAKARVQIDGKPVACTVEQGTIAFPVTVALSDGIKNYRIDF